jgi:hypothetical protein
MNKAFYKYKDKTYTRDVWIDDNGLPKIYVQDHHGLLQFEEFYDDYEEWKSQLTEEDEYLEYEDWIKNNLKLIP